MQRTLLLLRFLNRSQVLNNEDQKTTAPVTHVKLTKSLHFLDKTSFKGKLRDFRVFYRFPFETLTLLLTTLFTAHLICMHAYIATAAALGREM